MGPGLKSYEIPPDRAAVGVFSILDDVANKRTAALIEEIAKSNPKPGTVLQDRRPVQHFHGRTRHRSQGYGAAASPSRAIAAIKDKKGTGARVG